MSTDLEKIPEFISPITGEVVALSAPSEDLGHLLADIREAEGQLREAKREINQELFLRFDRDAKWTHHLPGLKLSGPSPKPSEEFDGEELRGVLVSLVREGALTMEAVNAAVEVIPEYKVHKKGINALRALGGRVKADVDACATEVEPNRYVKVDRV